MIFAKTFTWRQSNVEICRTKFKLQVFRFETLILTLSTDEKPKRSGQRRQSPYMCGGTAYDSETQGCCEGSVFDCRLEICCGDRTQKRPRSAPKCCGARVYDNVECLPSEIPACHRGLKRNPSTSGAVDPTKPIR